MFRQTMIVISVVMLVVSCGGEKKDKDTTPKNAQVEKPACKIGLPANVFTTCGCNPLQSSLEQRTAMLEITDQVRAKIMNCANGKVDVTVYKWDIAKANLQGCVSTETTLDPATRDLINKKVDESDKAAEPQLETWKGCYGKTLGS